MSKNKLKTDQIHSNEERLIDLLERIGASLIYVSTDLDKHGVAKAIGVGSTRITEILKGVEKQK